MAKHRSTQTLGPGPWVTKFATTTPQHNIVIPHDVQLTQGATVSCAHEDDYLDRAIRQSTRTLKTEERSDEVRSPLERDQLSYLFIYVLDPSIALGNKRSQSQCVLRLKQQLEKSLCGTHEDANVWLRCGCIDPVTNTVPRPILHEMARRLNVDIVCYDGTDVVHAHVGSAVAIALYRREANEPAFVLYTREEGVKIDVAAAKRVVRSMYIRDLVGADQDRTLQSVIEAVKRACQAFTKVQLQTVAQNLGVMHRGITKSDMMQVISRELDTY